MLLHIEGKKKKQKKKTEKVLKVQNLMYPQFQTAMGTLIYKLNNYLHNYSFHVLLLGLNKINMRFLLHTLARKSGGIKSH